MAIKNDKLKEYCDGKMYITKYFPSHAYLIDETMMKNFHLNDDQIYVLHNVINKLFYMDKMCVSDKSLERWSEAVHEELQRYELNRIGIEGQKLNDIQDYFIIRHRVLDTAQSTLKGSNDMQSPSDKQILEGLVSTVYANLHNLATTDDYVLVTK